MNELNTRLLEYLPDPNTVKGGIGGMVESLQNEAPLLVNEIIGYTIAYNLVWWALSLVCIASMFIWVKKTWAIGMELDNTTEGFSSFAAAVLIITWPIIWSFVLASHFDWIKAAIAPRLFMIEYVTGLMK